MHKTNGAIIAELIPVAPGKTPRRADVLELAEDHRLLNGLDSWKAYKIIPFAVSYCTVSNWSLLFSLERLFRSA